MSGFSNTCRAKIGCQNCRSKHLKCDEGQPACARCERDGIPCLRTNDIRFKHDANPSIANAEGSNSKCEYGFHKSQTWIVTAPTLSFFDETPELLSTYECANNDDVAASRTPLENPLSVSDRAVVSVDSAIPSPFGDDRSTNVSGGHSRPRVDLDDSTNIRKRRRLTFDDPVDDSLPWSNGPIAVARPVSQRLYPSPRLESTPRSTARTIHQLCNDQDSQNSRAAVSVGTGVLSIVHESVPQIHLDTSVWPLNNIDEARLLRHFVANLARGFDIMDPQSHFRKVVPQRAATCPILLNAILALSARHLSQVDGWDPLVSSKYHAECLKHLIPMLDNTAAILDETLLASIIILRHLEEIEMPVTGQTLSEHRSHLLGAHAFMAAQERDTVDGGVRQAAFWTGLRQEMYVAILNQRPIIPVLKYCNTDRSLEPGSDLVWAQRIVVLCADVVQYCFSDPSEKVQDPRSHAHLTEAVDKWHAHKPSSFLPFFYKAPSPPSPSSPASATMLDSPDSAFPFLWFATDLVVVGLQHYHLARILLASHHPGIPRLGPGRATQMRAIDEDIKAHVRDLCGICVSDPSNPPNFNYAHIGVTIAGERFTERREQVAVLHLLDRCYRHFGWSGGTAQKNLVAAWGWEEGEESADDDGYGALQPG